LSIICSRGTLTSSCVASFVVCGVAAAHVVGSEGRRGREREREREREGERERMREKEREKERERERKRERESARARASERDEEEPKPDRYRAWRESRHSAIPAYVRQSRPNSGLAWSHFQDESL